MLSAIKQLWSFQDASSRVNSIFGPLISIRSQGLKWSSPQAPFIKTNWDAAVKSSSKSIGLGGVVRNSVGEIQATFCRKMPTFLQPVIAEASAHRKAMSMC